jgi:hypothetical protein
MGNFGPGKHHIVPSQEESKWVKCKEVEKVEEKILNGIKIVN